MHPTSSPTQWLFIYLFPAVFKIYLRASFIIYLFAVLIVIYVISKTIVTLIRRLRGRPVPWITPVHLDAKFVGALIQIFLYTFQVGIYYEKKKKAEGLMAKLTAWQ